MVIAVSDQDVVMTDVLPPELQPDRPGLRDPLLDLREFLLGRIGEEIPGFPFHF